MVRSICLELDGSLGTAWGVRENSAVQRWVFQDVFLSHLKYIFVFIRLIPPFHDMWKVQEILGVGELLAFLETVLLFCGFWSEQQVDMQSFFSPCSPVCLASSQLLSPFAKFNEIWPKGRDFRAVNLNYIPVSSNCCITFCMLNENWHLHGDNSSILGSCLLEKRLRVAVAPPM